MSTASFEPPRRPPSQRSHLERLVDAYGRAHGIAVERTRRWLSVMAFVGALDLVRLDDGPRFLIKGGVSMELRLGLRARATKDVDVVFRGHPAELLDAFDEAFAYPYSGFAFRRKGEVEEIRETGTRRLRVQVSFGGRAWQTLQVEVARPEADELELVPVAISLADFKLDGPRRVACLSLRYQIAQKLHAVTEQPDDRPNLRFWDLIDLVLLRELLDESGLLRVHAACRDIFARRATHPWPPDVVVPRSWREPYAATARELGAGIPLDVELAGEAVRALISDIDHAGS